MYRCCILSILFFYPFCSTPRSSFKRTLFLLVLSFAHLIFHLLFWISLALHIHHIHHGAILPSVGCSSITDRQLRILFLSPNSHSIASIPLHCILHSTSHRPCRISFHFSVSFLPAPLEHCYYSVFRTGCLHRVPVPIAVPPPPNPRCCSFCVPLGLFPLQPFSPIKALLLTFGPLLAQSRDLGYLVTSMSRSSLLIPPAEVRLG